MQQARWNHVATLLNVRTAAVVCAKRKNGQRCSLTNSDAIRF